MLVSISVVSALPKTLVRKGGAFSFQAGEQLTTAGLDNFF